MLFLLDGIMGPLGVRMRNNVFVITKEETDLFLFVTVVCLLETFHCPFGKLYHQNDENFVLLSFVVVFNFRYLANNHTIPFIIIEAVKVAQSLIFLVHFVNIFHVVLSLSHEHLRSVS